MSWTMKSPHRCERVWMSLGNYALLAFNLNPFENGLLHATIVPSLIAICIQSSYNKRSFGLSQTKRYTGNKASSNILNTN